MSVTGRKEIKTRRVEKSAKGSSRHTTCERSSLGHQSSGGVGGGDIQTLGAKEAKSRL